MKIIFQTIVTGALLLASTAWTAAIAHDMQGMRMMKMDNFGWGHPGTAKAVDRTIHIEARDSMRFDPSKLTIEVGSTVKFVITNVGKIEHELVLGPVAEQQSHEQEMQAMVKSGRMHMEHADPNEVELEPGTTRTLIWTFTKPGSYQYGCHEPGHYAAGMVGIITVTKAN